MPPARSRCRSRVPEVDVSGAEFGSIVVCRYRPEPSPDGTTSRSRPRHRRSPTCAIRSQPLNRRAIRQAEVLGLATGVVSSEPTRSELEDRFLELCRRHRLPPPEVNVRIHHLEVDFLWRRERLIVETDGYRFHRGAAAFEHDHDRDLTLHSLGFRVRRLTYHQVTADPDRVASLLRKELQPG